jgi:hypothetical protein
MANLTAGTRPQPYGQGGRKVFLPVKATTQLWEGGMLAQISGACVPGTTSGAGDCIGVAEESALGGATDGATRVVVWTDKVFIFNAGTNAPTDATPIFSKLYMETDNTVGTGGIGGSGEGVAGRFMGMEDDGRVRVYVGPFVGDDVVINGATLANASTSTATALGRNTRYQVPPQSQNTVVTLSTSGAVVGDQITIVSVNTAAYTVEVYDAGNSVALATLVASKKGFVKAYFDGTGWQLDALSGT